MLLSDMKIDTDSEIDEIESQIQVLKEQLDELRRKRPREQVENYTFTHCANGEVRLSDLFGSYDTLILVHNMGKACSYCTMWADGFNGIVRHLAERTAFVLSSPDDPETLKQLAASRNWNFDCVSVGATSFIQDMGFYDDEIGLLPGVSVFEKEPDDVIYRVARAEFGPGDDFCVVWHFLALLPAGIDGWEPKKAD